LIFTITACNDTTKEPEGQQTQEQVQIYEIFDEEIIVGKNTEWELPGTLTIPKDAEGKVPVVVIIHGSGVVDRDGTVGRQTVYKDLAELLAKHGVASIRFDKRNYAHTDRVILELNHTVKDESIDDALQAVALAKTIEQIDPNMIFIAGHSQGGNLIPRIYEADKDNLIAGYISLAGNSENAQEAIPRQLEYILSLDETLSEEDKIEIMQPYLDAIEIINNLTEADRGSSIAALGAYATYHLDLANYNPTEEAKKIDKPMLFLQGGHDYQVTVACFEKWQEALKEKPNVSFILYPNLTHTFVKTENMGTPEDYNTYGQRMEEQVAIDIKNFILQNR
jgi:dipeptidyl aminopeptidase/acylaminoacyl peptidase